MHYAKKNDVKYLYRKVKIGITFHCWDSPLLYIPQWSYSYWLTGLGHFKTKTQHFINLCTHWWKNDQEYSKKYFFLPCTLCKLSKVMKFLGIKGPNQTDWLELVILNKKYHFINFCAYRQKNDHKNSNKYFFWPCTKQISSDIKCMVRRNTFYYFVIIFPSMCAHIDEIIFFVLKWLSPASQSE